MEDKQNSSDVSMVMKTEGLSSSSIHFLSSVATMQLGLSPTQQDAHSTQVPNPIHPVAASLVYQGSHVPTSPVHPTGPIPFQGSPVHITTSPVSGGPISFHATASGQQQLLLNSDLSSAYLLTPLAPSLSGGNATGTYFASHSPPSAATLLSSSPTHSLGSASPPVSIPAAAAAVSSSSLPLMQTHTVTGCHRPVGPSQSVDSYFTSHSHHGSLSVPSSVSSLSTSSTPHHARPTSLLAGTQQPSRSIFLPSVSESGRTPEAVAAGIVVSSPVDSIVTVRQAAHTQVEGEPRHGFANGDFASVVGATGSSRPHMHRRRRNSSGDLNSTRARRSSQGCHVQSPSSALENISLATAAMGTSSHHGRTRRRSHDHMERSRTSSRSGSTEPYTLNPQ